MRCTKKCIDNTALTWETDLHHGTSYAVCPQSGHKKAECPGEMMQEIYQNSLKDFNALKGTMISFLDGDNAHLAYSDDVREPPAKTPKH